MRSSASPVFESVDKILDGIFVITRMQLVFLFLQPCLVFYEHNAVFIIYFYYHKLCEVQLRLCV